jgi:hypothetical protein
VENDRRPEMGDKGMRPNELQAGDQESVPAAGSPCAQEGPAASRRYFLGRSARKLAYLAPVVLLIRPRPACASRIYS